MIGRNNIIPPDWRSRSEEEWMDNDKTYQNALDNPLKYVNGIGLVRGDDTGQQLLEKAIKKYKKIENAKFTIKSITKIDYNIINIKFDNLDNIEIDNRYKIFFVNTNTIPRLNDAYSIEKIISNNELNLSARITSDGTSGEMSIHANLFNINPMNILGLDDWFSDSEDTSNEMPMTEMPKVLNSSDFLLPTLSAINNQPNIKLGNTNPLDNKVKKGLLELISELFGITSEKLISYGKILLTIIIITIALTLDKFKIIWKNFINNNNFSNIFNNKN